MIEFQTVRGMPFPDRPWFKKENIEKTLDYVPKDGDIIITSYPKTGTNWLQYIVLQIITKGECFPSLNDCLYNKVPFMEMTGLEAIDNMKGLRMYKNHYRYDMVQKNPKSKVLYIYRSPEDTLVSWYHFLQSVREEEISFDEFFEGFLTGNMEYGSYFDHVLSYLDHKDDGNLLLVSYEKLHSNPREGILRIAKFLGDEFYKNLSGDESLLGMILEHTSFGYMKKNLIVTFPHENPLHDDSKESKSVIDFFRKGIVGDGKKSLSTDQLQLLKRKVAQSMAGTDMAREWLAE